MAGLGEAISGTAAGRTSIAGASVQVVRLAIGLAVVVSPLRVRWVIGGTAVPGLWPGYTDIAITPVGLAILVAVGAWLAGMAVGRTRPSFQPRWLIVAGAVVVVVAWVGVPSFDRSGAVARHGGGADDRGSLRPCRP